MKTKTLLMLAGLFLFLIIIGGCKNNITFSLSQIKQLTVDGDNGEAYFSSDNTHLVFQSKRHGDECDKIYTMTIEGVDLQRLPVTDGAFTCSYYSLDDKIIFFSSTLQDGPDCPEVYKHPNPHKYIWPLRNFEIYSIDKNDKLKKLTHFPGYNAEATVHPLEKKLFLHLYVMEI